MRKTAIWLIIVVVLTVSIPVFSGIKSDSTKNIEMRYGNDLNHEVEIRNNTPNSSKTDFFLYGAGIIPSVEIRTLMYFKDIEADFNNVTITLNLKIAINGPTYDQGNLSVYRLTNNYTKHGSNWNNKSLNTAWLTPGGDYNSTPLDTKLVTSQTQAFFSFDVTNFYWDVSNGTYDNLGFLLMIDLNEVSNNTVIEIASSWSGNSKINYPYIDVEYQQPTPPTTSITADKWTWLGFVNETGKTLATLYSEISNCQYVCAQNTTTGVYYTYGAGITDDFTVTYGMAVAVLCSSSSSWDHT